MKGILGIVKDLTWFKISSSAFTIIRTFMPDSAEYSNCLPAELTWVSYRFLTPSGKHHTQAYKKKFYLIIYINLHTDI